LDGRRNACAVGWISLGAMVYVARLQVVGCPRNGAGGVLEQRLFLLVVHQADQGPRLREIVGVFAMVPVIRRAFDGQGWFAVVGLLLPFPLGIGLVSGNAAVVAIDPHGAVAMVAVGVGRAHV